MKRPAQKFEGCVAVPPAEAQRLLSIGKTTLWRETASGRIRRLPCGTYAIEELKRYAKEESK